MMQQLILWLARKALCQGLRALAVQQGGEGQGP